MLLVLWRHLPVTGKLISFLARHQRPYAKALPQVAVSNWRRRSCAGWDASFCTLPPKKRISKRWREDQERPPLPRKKVLVKLWNEQLSQSLLASKANPDATSTHAGQDPLLTTTAFSKTDIPAKAIPISLSARSAAAQPLPTSQGYQGTPTAAALPTV